MSNTDKRPRFLGTSLLYFMGTVLSKLAVFLLLPLYTAKIPAGELGRMDVSVAIAVFAASVIFLDIGVAILRFYLQAEGRQEQGRVLSTGLCLMGLFTLLYLLVSVVLFLIFDISHFPLIALYGISNVLLLAAGYVARAVGARVRYTLSGLVAALLQVSLSSLFLLALDMGVRGLYIAYIIGALCGTLVSLLSPRAWCALRGNRPNARLFGAMLRFALPLGASAAAFLVLSSLSRVATYYFLGSEAAGHLAVALKFSQMILLVSACFQLAWQELALGKPLGKETPAYYTASTDLFLRIALAALLLLIPVTAILLWLFPRFLGAEYAAARGLLPPALAFSVAGVIATFFEPILAKQGKTGRILLSTLAGAVLNIGLTILVLALGGGVEFLLTVGAISFLVASFIRIFWLARSDVLRLTPWRYLLALLPLAFIIFLYYLAYPVLQVVALALALFAAMALLLPEILLLITKISTRKKEKCSR